MEPSNSANVFLECLTKKYPPGSECVETEIKNLKRKLNVLDDEFNDDDDQQLVMALDQVERKIKKPKLGYVCDICGKTYSQKRNQVQHIKTHFTSFKCGKCGKSYSRDYNRKKHEKLCTAELKDNESFKTFKCKHCDETFNTYSLLFYTVFEEAMSFKTSYQKVLPNFTGMECFQKLHRPN